MRKSPARRCRPRSARPALVLARESERRDSGAGELRATAALPLALATGRIAASAVVVPTFRAMQVRAGVAPMCAPEGKQVARVASAASGLTGIAKCFHATGRRRSDSGRGFGPDVQDYVRSSQAIAANWRWSFSPRVGLRAAIHVMRPSRCARKSGTAWRFWVAGPWIAELWRIARSASYSVRTTLGRSFVTMPQTR